MSSRSNLLAVLARCLVFGGVAVIGSMLALAQISAPPAKGKANGTAREVQNANPPPDQDGPQPAARRARDTDAQSSDDRAAPSRGNERGTQLRRRSEATEREGREGAADADRPQRQATDREPFSEQGGRRPARANLGIEFDAQAEGGLSIARIEEESIAARAGLRPHDRIVSVDGRTFANQRQLQAYLSGQFGRRVPLVIERGGLEYTVHLTTNEQADTAWLGVYLEDNEENQSGARIVQVFPAGPAARAGLRPGDVVVKVNGRDVAGAPELIAVIEGLEPRSRIDLAVVRNNQEVPLTAVLGSRESFVFRGQRDEESRDGRSFDPDDEFSNIPPFAMQLEHERRMYEQHQRIEEEIRKLQEEVRKLREALQRN
jgi:C-terminal processing protease CtpA/Prc